MPCSEALLAFLFSWRSLICGAKVQAPPEQYFKAGMFSLSVLGAIAVCLFPLWPPEVRLGIYYLSLAAAGFVGFILSLCVGK